MNDTTGHGRTRLRRTRLALAPKHFAAATVLSRQLNFKVPDDSFPIAGALDASLCLPSDWRPGLCRALLSRPIFDSASYGKIRFHHRRVSEYLAASWLSKLARKGCPTVKLEHILMGTTNAGRVVRPALAPIAAWLCGGNEAWNDHVRQWILESTPHIHLQHGDPAGLSLGYKQALIEALLQRAQGRKNFWLESSPESLGRLADPRLAELLSKVIRDEAVAVGLRIEVIQIVRYGRLTDCLGAILDVVARDRESEDVRAIGAAAVRDIGEALHRSRLAEIALRLPELPNHLGARITEALYPSTLSAAELVALLRKIKPTRRYYFDLPIQLRSQFKYTLTRELGGELLGALIELVQTLPTSVSEPGEAALSREFAWVAELLPIVLSVLLTKSKLTETEVQRAGLALMILRAHLRHHLRSHDRFADLHDLTLRHPAVRRSYLWQSVACCRDVQQPGLPHVRRMLNYTDILHLRREDIDWLIEDVIGQIELPNRELALRLAMELWNGAGRSFQTRKRIRRAVRGEASLELIFKDLNSSGRFGTLKRFWYQRIRYKYIERWWWQRLWRNIGARWNWLRDQWVLLMHFSSIRSGERSEWLAELAGEADADRTYGWAPNSWEDLRKKRGRWIATAAREGCKRFWRRFSPPLPHERSQPNRTDHQVIVGLAGLLAAAADDEIDWTALSDEEVSVATRYAVNELNDFPFWFLELARQRPIPVGEVLRQCVDGEWQTPAGCERKAEVMHKLVWHGDALTQLVHDCLLAKLGESDPPNPSVLMSALTILLRSATPPKAALAELAGARVRSADAGQPGVSLWLAVWLQIDASGAMNAFEAVLSRRADAESVMVGTCAVLSGRHHDRGPLLVKPSYEDPSNLRRFIPHVYRHVRLSDDVDRAGKGAFTPTARDNAQDFRNRLIELLAGSELPEVAELLKELAEEPDISSLREWIIHKAEEHRERFSDVEPWREQDVRIFAEEYEIDPRTDRDLFGIALDRLSDIKLDVERSDGGLREQVRKGDREKVLRRWLAQKLRERARGRYTVPEEVEIDQEERPDIRIENPNTGPVSIEIKWAQNCSLPQLFEGLEAQLLGRYLRAHNSMYGIYVLGMIGSKNWEHTQDARQLSFKDVVDLVRARAKGLEQNRTEVSGLEVVSIDFRVPRRQARSNDDTWVVPEKPRLP